MFNIQIVAFWVKPHAPSVSAGQRERLTLSSEHVDGMKQKQRESDTLNKQWDTAQSAERQQSPSIR